MVSIFLAVGYMVGKLFEVKLHWILYYHACMHKTF